MKANSNSNNTNYDSIRKKEKEELLSQVSAMGLNEALNFFKKSFKCSSEKNGSIMKKDFFSGTKTFFGKPKIINRCQFHPSTTVDIKHIAGYCCNSGYEMCPLFQLHACTNKLMSGIRR